MPTQPDLDLIRTAAAHAVAYAGLIDDRPAAPTPEAVAALAAFDEPFPEELDRCRRQRSTCFSAWADPPRWARPGRTTSASSTEPPIPSRSVPRSSWTRGIRTLRCRSCPPSPLRSTTSLGVGRSTCSGCHRSSDVAFVTGATVANASCLAAARDALLAAHGWDVQRDGLFGAPDIHVVIGEKAHSTLRKSLGLIGLGRERVTIVAADDQGRTARRPAPDGIRRRRTGARVRPSRRGEHRCVRPVRRDRRLGGSAQRLAPRRWCVRAVGVGRPGTCPSRRRSRSCRLVGDRWPQVVERDV